MSLTYTIHTPSLIYNFFLECNVMAIITIYKIINDFIFIQMPKLLHKISFYTANIPGHPDLQNSHWFIQTHFKSSLCLKLYQPILYSLYHDKIF